MNKKYDKNDIKLKKNKWTMWTNHIHVSQVNYFFLCEKSSPVNVFILLLLVLYGKGNVASVCVTFPTKGYTCLELRRNIELRQAKL